MDNHKLLKRSFKQYDIVLRAVSKLQGEKKLIDVGSGDCLIKPLLPKNIKYYSADMYGDCDYKIDLNNKKIPARDNTFDITVCLETLEHVFYPEKVIEELKRITKKDGLFILSMPNEYNFWLRLNYLFAIKKPHTDSPFEVISKLQHIHRPRVKDILSLFSKHFKIRKVFYIWQSRQCNDKGIVHSANKLINLLAKIHPSLFARMVVVIAENNQKQAKKQTS